MPQTNGIVRILATFSRKIRKLTATRQKYLNLSITSHSVGFDTRLTVSDANVGQWSQYVVPMTDVSIEVACDQAKRAAIAKIFEFGCKNEDFAADGVD
jgi:hypothetical protein